MKGYENRKIQSKKAYILDLDWISIGLNWIELANEQKKKTKHFETIVSENDGTKLVSHFLCLKSDYSVCLEVFENA